MSKAKINSNLDALGEIIGALDGMQKNLKDDAYTGALIKQAHGKTASAFDIAAASAASAGQMSHMYEYGTSGITRGPIRFPDPTAAEARLYEHKIVGKGLNQNVLFTFRPAVAANPQPTVKLTGVASKYLKRLSKRKYVFWNRAFVTETGAPVEIRTKIRSHLFVPFNDKPARNPAYADKHFVWWSSDNKGPIHSTPGEQNAGNFSKFWTAWWSATGANLMEKSVEKSVSLDTHRVVDEAIARANKHAVKESKAGRMKATVAKAKVLAEKVFKQRRMRGNG